VSVSLNLTSVALTANGSEQFVATVAGATNKTVTWSLSPAIGTISSTGSYKAPASLSATAIVTVTAASVADPASKATALVYLNLSNAAIAISPATISVRSRQNFQFTSTTLGFANPAVIWSVSAGGGGTITHSGLYTAPVVTANKNIIVRVTSATNPTKITKANVTVTP